MVSGQSQVLIWMVIFAVGFIFGGLIAWMLTGRSRGKEPARNPEQEAWLKLRRTYQERASLWQERATGRLAVRMGDQMVLNANELSDGQRKNLNATLKDWLVWLGFPVSQAPAVEPPAGTAAVQPSGSEVKSYPGASAAIPVATQPPGQAKPAQEKPKSIVEQINEILQEKLKNSHLANKGVRLVEDPRQGVVVWVGLEHYAGVDAVTDPEVKSLLKDAVNEWEQRQTPGPR